MAEQQRQWFWMMEWCKKRGLSPAFTHNWDEAYREWEKEQQKEVEELKQKKTIPNSSTSSGDEYPMGGEY